MKWWLICLIAATPICGAQSLAAESLVPLPAQPAGVRWPTAEWEKGPLPPSLDHEALNKLLNATNQTDGEMQETREVVIIWRGRLVAERYANEFGSDVRLVSWSMAKSITQSLVGIAALHGLIDVDQPLGNPAWARNDPHNQVSWRQWLNMVDGMDYREIGAKSIDDNDSADMLFGSGRLDIAGYAAKLPITHIPGTVWNYNSAGYDLVANALGQHLSPAHSTPATRRAAMARFMNKELFSPVGLHSALAEFDASGTFVGASLFYATARDFAKFGYLYLRDGVWDGHRILPVGWVDFARRKTPAGNSNIYGAGWWIVPAREAGTPFESGFPSEAPRDIFYASGHDVQMIVVVPSKDLVVVRLGVTFTSGGEQAVGRWMTSIINLFPDI